MTHLKAIMNKFAKKCKIKKSVILAYSVPPNSLKSYSFTGTTVLFITLASKGLKQSIQQSKVRVWVKVETMPDICIVKNLPKSEYSDLIWKRLKVSLHKSSQDNKKAMYSTNVSNFCHVT